MKSGQLVECSLRKFFLRNRTENCTEKLVPHLNLFSENSVRDKITNGQNLNVDVLIILDSDLK